MSADVIQFPQREVVDKQWECRSCTNNTFTLWENGDVHCAECGKLNYMLRFNPADIEVSS